MIKSSESHDAVFRNSTLSGDITLTIDGSNPATNQIENFNTSGVEVGTNDRVNKNGKAYYYISFKFANVLSAKWISFEINADEKGDVVAHWLVADDLDAADYVLERSIDGVNFFEVNSLPALNSPAQMAYSVLDQNPPEGRVWYRVKQNNNQGGSSLSDVKTIFKNGTNSEKLNFIVFPNPNSGNEFSVKFASEISHPVEISILDINGKMEFRNVFSNESLEGVLKITPFQTLSAGMYFVGGKSGNEVFIQKILVR